jgi:diadenosine tetraphosphatase ApaH/serine/threonine PP2A family protein phosphatase
MGKAAWFSRLVAVFQGRAVHGFDLTSGPHPDHRQRTRQTARGRPTFAKSDRDPDSSCVKIKRTRSIATDHDGITQRFRDRLDWALLREAGVRFCRLELGGGTERGVVGGQGGSMRIALLSDIHANREAFAACLAHAESARVDRYVFLGDYVGYGADPGWAIDTVKAYVERGAVAVLGNHDAAIGVSQRMSTSAEIALAWTRTRLDWSQRDFLARLPLRVEEEERLYVHANAWAPDKWGYIFGPVEAARSLQATACRLSFCGHVHVPQLYHVAPTAKVGAFAPMAGKVTLLLQRRWLAVLGSVGQPRDGVPAAAYAIFDTARSDLLFLRVPYDIAAAAAKVRAAGLPLILSQRLELGY